MYNLFFFVFFVMLDLLEVIVNECFMVNIFGFLFFFRFLIWYLRLFYKYFVGRGILWLILCLEIIVNVFILLIFRVKNFVGNVVLVFWFLSYSCKLLIWIGFNYISFFLGVGFKLFFFWIVGFVLLECIEGRVIFLYCIWIGCICLLCIFDLFFFRI